MKIRKYEHVSAEPFNDRNESDEGFTVQNAEFFPQGRILCQNLDLVSQDGLTFGRLASAI